MNLLLPAESQRAARRLSSRWLPTGLCLLAGLSALFGGAVLIARPDGSILGMPLYILDHSPFHDFLIPGLVLFSAVGVVNTGAAWLQIRRTDGAAYGSLLGGVLLAGWIIVESILLRSLVSLQIGYLLLGLAIVAESLRELRRLGPPSAARAPHAVHRRSPAVVPSPTLKAIKVAHTIVWALLAACVLAIPLASWRVGHRAAGCLAAVVAVEVVVLGLNHGRCPLTSLAARHTEDRRENFDIYLPEWLARNNKRIFGSLYIAGVAFALARWVCGLS